MAPLGVLALFVYVCMYVCSFVQNQPIVSDFVNYRFRFFFGGGELIRQGVFTRNANYVSLHQTFCVVRQNLCRVTQNQGD
jgi:hypothetical protein